MRDVIIHPNGDGRTRYLRNLSTGEAEIWVVVTMAGIEGELARFGNAPVTGHVDAIRAMAQRLGIRFIDLDGARAHARQLVRLHRPAIEVVADALLDIRELLSFLVCRVANNRDL